MYRGRCRCSSCSNYGLEGKFSFDGALDYRSGKYVPFVPHPCEMCKIFHPHDVQEIDQLYFVHPTVSRFLGIENFCQFCRNVINMNVQYNFRLCWGEAPDEAIELALCKMLRDILKNEANRDTYHKYIITRCINDGEKLPPWANREDMRRAALALTTNV